jgi:hypothetical protein
MAPNKYDKYIINTQSLMPFHPLTEKGVAENMIHMFDMNKKVVKEAKISMFCATFRGLLPKSQIYKPHVHDFDEINTYFGTNPDDPFDLGGEIEIWIDDERHLLTKSSAIYFPKGLKHNPWWINKIERPIIAVYIFSTSLYTAHFVDDPKWRSLPVPPVTSL